MYTKYTYMHPYAKLQSIFVINMVIHAISLLVEVFRVTHRSVNLGWVAKSASF